MALTRSTPEQGPWPTRWFQQWLDRSGRPAWPDWSDLWPAGGGGQFKIEEYREGDELVIKAELPGVDPDKDVEITMSDHMLQIRAERRKEERTEDERGYRSEFSYGSFARSVPLPAGATEADVKASYNDGILEVRIPVDAEAAEARKIPIARQ